MLKACCYSLDLCGQKGSPFLKRMTRKPESPMLAIESSFLFRIATKAVAEPTALTLLKAC